MVDTLSVTDSAPAPTFHVVVPASDEAGWIDACLRALALQEGAGPFAVTVAANACRDDTALRARSHAAALERAGGRIAVIETDRPGKLPALNLADRAIEGAGGGAGPRLYLDADIAVEPAMLRELRAALAVPAPRYATGTIAVAPARTRTTRAYARMWRRTPFVRGGAVGAGLAAVNPAGRRRWGDFPEDIISDDTFARLHFAPSERVEVPARYHWPMVEGIGALVRVRRRQDVGVRQIAARWPALMENEGKARWDRAALARAALGDPGGFAVYGAVHLLTRLDRRDARWSRGR